MAGFGSSGGSGGGASSARGQQAKQAANRAAFPGETQAQWNNSFNTAYRGLAAKPAIPKASTPKVNAAKPATAATSADKSAYAKAQANAQTYPGQSKADWNAAFNRAFGAYQPASKFAGPGVPSNSGLLDPNSTLSGQSLYDAAVALADSQTQPTITGLARQIATNNQNTQAVQDRTSGYFNQLGQVAGQATQTQQNIAGGLNQTLQGIGRDTQQQLQGIQGSALGALNQYAPGAGVAGAAAPALSTELGRQQGLAAQQAGNQQAFGAQQGGNAQIMSAAAQGTGALRGQERLGNIARAGNLANEPIQAKLAAAIATRGADIKSAIGKLRQQEVTNSLARQGLGVKQQGNAISAQRNQITQANNQANNQLKNRELNIVSQNNQANQTLRAASINNTANYQSESLALRAAGTNLQRGGGRLSQSQQNTLYRNLDQMASLINQAHQNHLSDSQIKNALATGKIQKGFPAQSSVLVEAAYELLGWGYVLPGTASAMQRMGLTGGSFRGKPIRTGNAPKATVGRALGGVGGSTFVAPHF